MSELISRSGPVRVDKHPSCFFGTFSVHFQTLETNSHYYLGYYLKKQNMTHIKGLNYVKFLSL